MNANSDSLRFWPRLRIPFLIILYGAVLSFCLWMAYQLRFDFFVGDRDSYDRFQHQLLSMLLWAVPMKLVFLLIFRQFSGLLSYFSTPDLQRLFWALLCGSGVLGIARLAGGIEYAPPRGVILIDFMLSFMVLSGARLAFRLFRERFLSESEGNSRRLARRVAIIGAGDVGASLAKELKTRRGLGMNPVVFLDDDQNKWRSRIYNIPVIGSPEVLTNRKLNLRLEEAVIAMPNAPAKRIGEIVELLQKAHLKFTTVPSVDQLTTGKVRISQLREVEIADLLGREPVKLQKENISDYLKNRVVMVTGAGGSIGSELCRQIAEFNPSRLLLVEQSEVQIFPIEQELIEKGYQGIILPLVADVADEGRMRFIFERFQPNVVFHAAAHKHVPMMENQPGEAIKNNTLATVRLANLSLEYRVDRFVMISTDKAINPTNVMGATKRLAEIYIQALFSSAPDKTKFMAVRFGNVLGSSGSVIPTFKRQIASGGPVKVTHPEITRYFMTIPEAVGLVLQSGAQGEGGEIFVLDMGEPIKIVNLARQLIELSGLVPDEDIEIEFTGLRPGEKLYEELQHDGEDVKPTDHPKIMCFVGEPRSLEEATGLLDAFNGDLDYEDPDDLKTRLQKAVPEYTPYRD